MKSKALIKKLILNKKTITHLKNGDMREVYGGHTILPTITCVCSIPGAPCS